MYVSSMPEEHPIQNPSSFSKSTSNDESRNRGNENTPVMITTPAASWIAWNEIRKPLSLNLTEAMLSFALLCTLVASAHAMVSVSFDHQRQHLNLTAYNAVAWTFPTPTFLLESNNTAIPLIPLHEKSGDYDPCDESTFNGDVMASLLQEWWQNANYTEAETETEISSYISQPWIGYVSRNAMKVACGNTPLFWLYAYHAIASAQKLGANGILLDENSSPGVAVHATILYLIFSESSHTIYYNTIYNSLCFAYIQSLNTCNMFARH